MKKITLLTILVLTCLTANAFGFSIINNTYDDQGTTYTVVDRSDSPDQDTANGMGGYTGLDYTGSYIGTFTGGNNDNLLDATWESIIFDYLGSAYTVSGITKVDAPDTTTGDLTITYDASTESGTWSTLGSDPAVAVEFYSVKAAQEFAVYYVDPALQSGDWTTRHLLTPNGNNQPGISHLSASLSPTTPASVPEPATVPLLGTGLLVGLAGLTRRKLHP